ncbi:hypothetical protein MF672_018320 [Actinomadura sp. ATCC 31491]|uniref:Helix-turn-helix domain-containing protein n=1 Tax=Actinomadura luzonensis TaxID=2805427 RepID=A0ABT0FTS8_9ACTN|nr:hypothetical protein [Actinomadura luzonensis]MCK2215732.1 hypothetical protein [Actinomadura luzonensis]
MRPTDEASHEGGGGTMPSKEQVLRLLAQGHGYDEIAGRLGVPAGRAYLIATGIPADGGDTVTRKQRERPGMLPSHAQRLVNPREVNPTVREDVHAWIRRRAWSERAATPAAPSTSSGENNGKSNGKGNGRRRAKGGRS